MIKLDNNYSIAINSTHGFELHYKGEAELKTVIVKGEKVEKEIVPTDTWYFPKMSLVLKKYFSLSVYGDDVEELKSSIENIEKVILKFEKTFAIKGELLTVS